MPQIQESPSQVWPLGGATSFEELETRYGDGSVESLRQARLDDLFIMILNNLVYNPDIKAMERRGMLHQLVSAYDVRSEQIVTTAPTDALDSKNDLHLLLPSEKAMKRKPRAKRGKLRKRPNHPHAFSARHTKSPIKRENGIDFPAGDYAFVPDPMLPSTWKIRLAEAPGKVTLAQLGRAAAALSAGGFRGNRALVPDSALSAVKRRIRAEYRKLKVPENRIPNSVKGHDGSQGFTLWKDAVTGNYRWFAVYSNNFMDRDYPPEIISEESHKAFVALVDAGMVDYPELWHWLVPGTAWGKADWLDYVDGFAVASGYVYPGHEKEAETLIGREDLGVSHGMPYSTILRDPSDPNVIRFHITREISDLPHWAAANALTDFVILKEAHMPIAPKKREFLRERGYNDEYIDEIDAQLAKARAAAEEAGVLSKEAEDDFGPEDEFEEYEDEFDEDEADEKEGPAGDESDDEEFEDDEDDEDEGDAEDDADARKGRPQGGSVGRSRSRGSKRDVNWNSGSKRGVNWNSGSGKKPSSFAGSSRRGRPQGGSVGQGSKRGVNWNSGSGKKPSSFAGSKRDVNWNSGDKREPMRGAGKKRREKEAPASDYLTMEQFAAVLEPILTNMTQMGEAMGRMSSVLKELRANDESRLAALKEVTPTRSFESIIERVNATFGDSTVVDRRTKEGQDAPKETQVSPPQMTPIPFINNHMANISKDQ